MYTPFISFQDSDVGLPLGSDPMMQPEHQMSMTSYDPIVSEEQGFDDYSEDRMMDMDPAMDSRPGQQQDYFDSEYGSTRFPPVPSSPDPLSQPSHATASINHSKHDTSNKDASEMGMSSKGMAAFLQHQDILDSDVDNTKRFRSDIALSRQDTAGSIPSSSDMISVKNIEDREDEYGKMKLALLSDIAATSYNGSASPIAAITSPSLARDLLSPRGKEEELSSVNRSRPTLGPRTRSKDNLESIFGGTSTSGQADKLNLYISNTSVVNTSLVDADENIALACNTKFPDNISEQRARTGIIPTTHDSMSKSDPSVKPPAASTSSFLSHSNSTASNSKSNRLHGNNYNKDNQYNKDTLNTSQNKISTKHTTDAKCPSSSPRIYPNKQDDKDRNRYSSVPSVTKSIEVIKHGDKVRRPNRQQRPSRFVREDPFPVDILPESNVILADFHSTKAQTKFELDPSLGASGKGETISAAPNISSSTTGDVYTIPEVPEEEEDSSPLGADGVSRRRIAGKSD